MTTYSDSCARNHKLTYNKLRAGTQAFAKLINNNYEEVARGLRPVLFAHDTESGSAVQDRVYYMRTNGNYDLAVDLGPVDRATRTGIVFCCGTPAAGSAYDAIFFVQGVIRRGTAHGATPGIHGYLSKTTPGLVVPNEGGTGGYSDAFNSGNPIILGTYLPGNLFLFHPRLIYQ